MTKSDGTPRINGVEIGELSLTVLGTPSPVLAVKAALVNTETGDRFGYTNRNTDWSEKTLLALDALIACVEADVCLALFEGGTTSGGGVTVAKDTSDGVASL